MAVILVAGLTPAWQQIMSFGDLQIGAVNRAGEVHWCASGKAINAAVALASLGVQAHVLSPAGGWTGHAMRDELTSSAGKLAMTWINTERATRVCTTVLSGVHPSPPAPVPEGEGRNATELVENASQLSEEELREFQAQYRACVADADFVVLTGSLPCGTPPGFYRDLLEGTRCPALLDGRGPELIAALECKPSVVKPNREELALTVGRALTDRVAVLGAMRELIERGAGSVIVTQGHAAVWVMQGAKVWELTPPTVSPVVNPIGCGDCLAAGVAAGLARGDALVDAVRLGIAAATVNVTHLLPARLDGARVEALTANVQVRALT